MHTFVSVMFACIPCISFCFKEYYLGATQASFRGTIYIWREGGGEIERDREEERGREDIYIYIDMYIACLPPFQTTTQAE